MLNQSRSRVRARRPSVPERLLFHHLPHRLWTHGFTLVEVSVATLLVCVGLASIVAIHGRSIQVLRATHQAAAASQILQQRVDRLRSKPWVDVATSAGLARVMSLPTDSERELPGTRLIEVLTVAAVQPSEVGPVPGASAFTVQRADRSVTIRQAGDLSGEATLLVSSTISWEDPHGKHERSLRSIICRVGLTRSGILGSGLGRAVPATP